jgi:ribosomal protein L21
MKLMDEFMEKVDKIRERTGVTYREAKEALEKTGGDLLEALILLEEDKKTWTEQINVAGADVIDKLREIIKSGNVNRIKVKKGDSIILDIPVTAGAVGAVLLPYITALGAAVAFVSKCTIEIERPYKDSVNVNAEVEDMVKMAEKKANEFFNKDKEKDEDNS